MTTVSEMRNMFDVAGKVAVVVGAGQGIGQGIAYAFGANGGKVVAADIRTDTLEATVAAIKEEGGEAIGVPCDSTKLGDVEHLTSEAIRKYGRIDCLYVVPGINVRKSIANYSYDEFDKVVNVNLKGSFQLLKEISKEIVKNKEGGSIVVISSTRCIVTEPGQSVYASTKAGLVMLARTLAAELGKYNVRVNAIAPGAVETPLTTQIKSNPDWYNAYANRSALKRWGQPKEIAGPALFLASEAASFITGSVLFADGGWTAIDGRYEPSV
jgi:NAD(P)-dependent dehydrogenase (short-subunit alcohol dehydrogenase family)